MIWRTPVRDPGGRRRPRRAVAAAACLLAACTLAAALAGVAAMAADKPAAVLESLPENYSLPHGRTVLVENDGRCARGEVILITGGKKSAGIPRRHACVKRPQ